MRDPRWRPRAAAPPGVETVNVPIDDSGDVEFWFRMQDEALDGTPLYYRTFLEHKPERCAAAAAYLSDTGLDAADLAALRSRPLAPE